MTRVKKQTQTAGTGKRPKNLRTDDKVTVRVRPDGSYAMLFKGNPLLVKGLTKTETGRKSLSVAWKRGHFY
jgi:hypothetical protein